MGRKYSSTAKTCASCEYWLGAREPDRAPNWVVVESQKAKCGAPNGPWRSKDTNVLQTCKAYTKWRYV